MGWSDVNTLHLVTAHKAYKDAHTLWCSEAKKPVQA